jgi:NAD(P)-dependent dehydrogenase (short-subunit alcohol dehydrogenase family)
MTIKRKTDPKIALVTGAGSGIGRAVSVALGGEGYMVVLAGRRKAALMETAQTIGPENTLVIPTDVTMPESVSELFAKTIETFGRLDLLFNNAGIGAPAKPLEELSFEEWKSVIDCNLHGVFLCAQHAFRIMKAQRPQGGRIINNGSISAHVPRPNSIPYTASKHGVTGITRSINLDGRTFNICCGQIDIGNAASDMTRNMSGGIQQADGTYGPEPVISVADVARAVLYMASLPLNANVPFMTVMANGMPYIGRG